MLSETIRSQMAKAIKHVEPPRFDSTNELTADLYRQMESDFMAAPLLVLHSSLPKVMAGVWSILRESLMAGQVERVRKEIVAAAVSKSNECPFCVEAHTLMLHATADHGIADAIVRGDYQALQGSAHEVLLQWALATRNPEVIGKGHPPFSPQEAPEIIGTAVAFHYINRMVNIFLGESLLPLPAAIKGITHRLYAATAGKKIVRPLQPGNSLKFIKQATLPREFSWAATNPTIASAFAGFAHEIEQAGESVLPATVRNLVLDRVAAWQGEEMGMSRRWVDLAVAELKEDEQPAARLALLAALSSYQIGEDTIEAFRYHYPLDAQLIAATAWASLAAARRVSSWLVNPTAEAVLR